MSSSRWPGSTSWFRRMTRGRSAKPARCGRSATRRLRLEPLESRSLLSATVLSSISGNAYQTGNGTASNAPLPGIVINLYKDGGDGKFEGNAAGSDDQLVATATTDSSGNYRFNNLQSGTYFAQEVESKLVPANGQSWQQVAIGAGDTAGVANTSIDSFSNTSQYVSGSLHAGKTGGSATVASEALGGYRDLYVQLTSPVGSVSLGANADVPGFLDFGSGAASTASTGSPGTGPATRPRPSTPPAWDRSTSRPKAPIPASCSRPAPITTAVPC